MKSFIGLALLASTTLAANDQQPLFGPLISNAYPIPSIPPLGFGTWNLRISDHNTTNAVAAAIVAGYVHIDCAAAYSNQVAVGAGIKKGLLAANKTREEIWVTSKLWNDHHAPSKVAEGLSTTLKELGLEYLDLYLMHWPVGPAPDGRGYAYDYLETWQAMTKLLALGTVRQIGVSNFSPDQLGELLRKSIVKPAVHQMELHPYLQQWEWLAYHQREGIRTTAYSPLGNTNPTYHHSAKDEPPRLLSNDVLVEIGKKRDCTAAQVALAWNMQRGVSVIPKSSHVSYMEENFGSTTCPLSFEDLGAILGIRKDYVKRFNNPSKGWGVELFDGLEDS